MNVMIVPIVTPPGSELISMWQLASFMLPWQRPIIMARKGTMVILLEESVLKMPEDH